MFFFFDVSYRFFCAEFKSDECQLGKFENFCIFKVSLRLITTIVTCKRNDSSGVYSATITKLALHSPFTANHDYSRLLICFISRLNRVIENGMRV